VPRLLARRAGLSAAAGILALLFAGAPSWVEESVDLALVLAVDASGSVDSREYDLQLRGIAGALRDPEVQRAIAEGPSGRIAINLLVWAQHEVPKDESGWNVLASPADLERFAAAVERFPRNVSGATGLGEGIAAALRALETSPLAARREVIDVSGDGAETPARDYFVMIDQARAMANARGVVINGLVILGEDGVEGWYRRKVLLGPEAFLEIARDYEDFAAAMRRKLLREIVYRPRLSHAQ
jgi:hypothetical protein